MPATKSSSKDSNDPRTASTVNGRTKIGDVIVFPRPDPKNPDAKQAQWWRKELTSAINEADSRKKEGGRPLFVAKLRVARAQLWLSWRGPARKSEYAKISEDGHKRAAELCDWIEKQSQTDQIDIDKLKEDGLQVVKDLEKVEVFDNLTEEDIKGL